MTKKTKLGTVPDESEEKITGNDLFKDLKFNLNAPSNLGQMFCTGPFAESMSVLSINKMRFYTSGRSK